MENKVLVHLGNTDYTCRLEHGEHQWTLDEHRHTPDKKIKIFTSEIQITGNINDEQLQRLQQIVKACPVSKTLEAGVEIETIVKRSNGQSAMGK